MYTSFYDLHSKPFQISSDPDFMWLGEKHREALATLRYGILDNKGFLLLTGDVGTGKTTLINALLQSLDEGVICTSVPDPSLEKMDFLNYIAAAFGMDREFQTKGAFLGQFRQFLNQAYENNKKVLLIIDESQLLTQEILEEIRLLSNIERTDAKLINIFFVGQNEFNEILNRQQNRAVRQRLTLNYNLDPLTPDETGSYIKHRLKVAGTEAELFTMDAVQEIFMYSGGFPRRINILCDHALLSGYVKETSTIDHTIVRECAKELKIPAQVKNRNINGFIAPLQKPADTKPVRPYIPPVQAGETDTEENKMKGFSWILALAVILIFSWFLIFPDHFKSSIYHTRQSIMAIKTRIFPQKAGQQRQAQPPTETRSRAADDPRAPFPATSDTPNHSINPAKTASEANEPEKRVQDKASPFKVITSPIPAGAKPDFQDSIKPIQNGQANTNPPPAAPPPGQSSNQPDTNKTYLQGQSSHTQEGRTIEKGEPISLPRESVIVRFKYNTNDFTQTGYQDLENFAGTIVRHPRAKILVTGYTDSEGYEPYNRKLSEFRANIVKSYLLGKGVLPDQVAIKGRGSENPLESNATAWGRMMNRRVEINVTE